MTPEEFKSKIEDGSLSQDDFDKACNDLAKKMDDLIRTHCPPSFEVVTAVMLSMLKVMVSTCPKREIRTFIAASIGQTVNEILQENDIDGELLQQLINQTDEDDEEEPPAETEPALN